MVKGGDKVRAKPAGNQGKKMMGGRLQSFQAGNDSGITVFQVGGKQEVRAGNDHPVIKIVLPEEPVEPLGDLHQVLVAVAFHIEIKNEIVPKVAHRLRKRDHLCRRRLAVLPDIMLL